MSPYLYWEYDYLSILGLKLIHANKSVQDFFTAVIIQQINFVYLIHVYSRQNKTR